MKIVSEIKFAKKSSNGNCFFGKLKLFFQMLYGMQSV